LKGTSTGTTLRVTPYPVAWNIKIVDDDDHRGFEYVRPDEMFFNVLYGLTKVSF